MVTRTDWVDYAKGICIFFVVMLHVNDLVQNHVDATGWLQHVVAFARPFRMPDFFLIAGLFLSRAIDRPWRLYIDRKVIHFYYFYVLWMTVEFAFFDVRRAVLGEWSTVPLVLAYLKLLVNPSGALWFIHILPVFFLLTRVTKSVPWWLMWLGAAALHSVQLKTGWIVPDEFASRYIYFYSGYVFAAPIFRIAAWALSRTHATVMYMLAWGLANAALVGLGWSSLPGVSLALGFAGALAVVLLAGLLSKVHWTSPIRVIGQHSIVIYLGDYVVSIVAMRLLLPFFSDIGSLALTVTLATILGTMLLWQALLRTPLRLMYVRPALLHLKPTQAPRPYHRVVGPAHDALTVLRRVPLRERGSRLPP